MAGRPYGQVFTSIWSDPDFVALSRSAQCTYLMLFTYPTINYAGVIPLTERRWSGTCQEMKPADIERDIEALAQARFVVVDEDTEELLVRSFIRNDQLWKQPRLLGAALREALTTASPGLREALAQELTRIGREAVDGQGGDDLHQRLAGAIKDLLGGPELPPDPGHEPWSPESSDQGMGQGTRGRAPAAAAAATSPSNWHRAPSSGTSDAAAALVDERLPSGIEPKDRGRLIGHATKAFERGAPPNVVAEGIDMWLRRDDAKPGLLPHLIGDAARRAAKSVAPANSKSSAWADIADQLEADSSPGAAVIQLPGAS